MSGGRRHYPADDNLSGLCFPQKVGNVRSCRLYYVYFAKEFEAVYFHAGESKYALDVLNSSFIDNVDGITGKGGAFYYRDNSRRAPHNLYTTGEKFSLCHEDIRV